MPVVTVDWYEGRTDEQKSEVAEKITAALVESAGATPESVWIRFNDSPKKDWAIGGVKNDG